MWRRVACTPSKSEIWHQSELRIRMFPVWMPVHGSPGPKHNAVMFLRPGSCSMCCVVAHPDGRGWQRGLNIAT